MPQEQAEAAMARLPKMTPVVGPWLFCDDAYGAQMALRRHLLATQSDDVFAQTPDGLAAGRVMLTEVIAAVPDGFSVNEDTVICPDGHREAINWDAPLRTIGCILQQDVCILEKRGAEHVLTGAVLCFPASWMLAEKIGKPLIGIHGPVDEYDTAIATRVQRLFDGVQLGQPLWRANLLRYDDAALFQPRSEADRRKVGGQDAPYVRSERQTVLRLPYQSAAAFVIHTTVVRS